MWDLSEEIKKNPIFIKGKSGYWVLGANSDVRIPNPPYEDKVRKVCPKKLYKEEFIDIGLVEIHGRPIFVKSKRKPTVKKEESPKEEKDAVQ